MAEMICPGFDACPSKSGTIGSATRSALEPVSDHSGHRAVSGGLSGLRREGGKDRTAARQGSVQPAVRRCSGARSVRVHRCGVWPAVCSGGEHGADHRSALSGALGGETAEAGFAADGDGRNLGKSQTFLTVGEQSA